MVGHTTIENVAVRVFRRVFEHAYGRQVGAHFVPGFVEAGHVAAPAEHALAHDLY